MGFVLPHLFSQVYFTSDEPVPPCDFFFSWGGRIGEKGVDFEYCPALQKHIIMGEKKFSPLGLKQYFQLLCIFPDPYTVSKRNDFFCRC